MKAAPQRDDDPPRLRLALVLRATEESCTVVGPDGSEIDLRWASFFPRPRAERVAPGHLVAVAAAAADAEVVAWRWFDAVVLAVTGDRVRLWEPGHGEVTAQPRQAATSYRPGTRAYLSAGLPGAQWWVAGPAVPVGKNADVEVEEVGRFLTDHSLWDRLPPQQPS